MSPIDKAIEFFLTQKALADAIGANPSQISHWKQGVKPVPPHRAKQIERATKGAVKAAEFFPDLFGDAA